MGGMLVGKVRSRLWTLTKSTEKDGIECYFLLIFHHVFLKSATFSPQSMIRSIADFTNDLEGEFDSDDFLFRGQPDDSDLIPKLARLSLQDVLATERQLLADFRREALPYLDRHVTDSWEWLAVASIMVCPRGS